MTKTQIIKIRCTDEQHQYILNSLTMDNRAKVLLDEADRVTGEAVQRRLSSLTDKNAGALMMWPVFCGGDSSDMETFITDVWPGDITNDNLRDIFEAFRQWYKAVAPDEYRDPHAVAAEMRRSGINLD